MTRSLLRLVAPSAAVLLTACSGTEPVGYDFMKVDGEGELGSWVHSGLYNREYELHLPPGLTDADRRPLVIFLHGAGDTGPAFRRRIRPDALTDARRLITVWPSGLQGSWTVGCSVACTVAEALLADDVGFLGTLVRTLATQLPVDTTRVYVLGFSQGAQLAHYFACAGNLTPAGLGVVSGEIHRSVARACSPRAPFPVGIVHGTDDPVAYYVGFGTGATVMSVPETVETWRGLMACAAEPTMEILPATAGDYTWTEVYSFPGCRTGAALALYRVVGGGHNWPGDTGPWPLRMGLHSRSLDATRELLDLLQGVDPRRSGALIPPA